MSCCCERQSVMNECWHILMDLLPQISDLITIFINQEIKIITQSIKLQIFGFLKVSGVREQNIFGQKLT